MSLILKAQEFAHRAHDSIQQKRKYSGQPYWVHTDEVALIGADALSDENQAKHLLSNRGAVLFSPAEVEQAVAAYHLHDILEDVWTELTRQNRLNELAAFEAEFATFPDLTRRITVDLTDVYISKAYPKLNRAARHKLENERLSKIHPLSKTGKLADLISNTKSIVAEDKDFAVVYLREKFELLPHLLDGSSVLLQRATAQTIAGFHSLGLQIPQIR